MRKKYHQMMRTTLDIDDVVLERLKAYKRKRGGTLGALASGLLARALKQIEAEEQSGKKKPRRFTSYNLGELKVSLFDKDALYEALDKPL